MMDHAHVYGDSIADLYDRLCPVQDEVPVTVDFIAGLCGEGGSVLEMGVGTGRLAIPLAERGLRVHGVDASQHMLNQLKAKDTKGLVTTSRANFATMRLEDRFDVVLLAYNTLFYLTEQADQVECVRTMAAHLAEGGRIVVDTYDPAPFHALDGQKVTVQPLSEQDVVLVAGQAMPPMQLLLLRQTVYAQGGIRNIAEVHRYCWPSELDLMARLANLALVERWGDWEKSPNAAGAGRHISVYAAAG